MSITLFGASSVRLVGTVKMVMVSASVSAFVALFLVELMFCIVDRRDDGCMIMM